MLQVVRKHKRLQAGTRPREVGAIKSLRGKGVPLASAAILTGATVVVGVAALSVLGMPVHAAEQSSNGTAAYSGNLNLTANVAEAGLSVTLPNGSSATLNLAPPFSGYSNDSTTVTVAVGSHSNYKLYMSGDTNLTDGSGHNIPTLANCSSGCAMTDNTNFANAWGYAIGTEATNYYGLQTAASTIDNAGTGSGSSTTLNTYQIKFGAKVDHTVTPGTYTGTVNFIAVADVNSNIYMQYMTSDQCTTTASTVYDVRDGKSYKIQKLADNKCWMLDNLALDPTNSNTIVNEYNTNASATTLAAFKNGASSVAGLDNTSGKYASSGIVANPNTAATAGLWDSNTDNWTVPRVNTSKIATTQNQAWGSDENYPSYGSYNIGVYYNFCAASAGSYCYGSGSAPASDARATEDICPSGWRLPTGGGSGEFQALYNAYDATAVNGVNGYAFRAALSTPLSGNTNSGAVGQLGVTSAWWSSTRGNDSVWYYIYMYGSGVNPNDNFYRSGGFNIRCLLKSTPNN